MFYLFKNKQFYEISESKMVEEKNSPSSFGAVLMLFPDPQHLPNPFTGDGTIEISWRAKFTRNATMRTNIRY